MTPDGGEGQLDLFGAPPAPGAGARRADLGRRGAVPAELWRAWLDDPALLRRFRSLVCWRGPDRCAYWLGSIGSTGHGRLRVGSHTDGTRHVVGAHVAGFQIAHGVIEGDPDAVVAHACDEPSCVAPGHLRLVDRLDNIAEYTARRGSGPLADTRGARGRAVAIRDAILDVRAAGGDVEAAIAAAAAAGLPPTGDALF
ncbi:HNH endonuclease family protein [Nocardiopsis baichengensis]|uniref:HNH endonuclease n=1 Tax=Nocardiopsis baichengensis TaxID=280240 RepID=UPI00034B25C3|nr:HNH endonuclease [Nocardiopsis baichengensis]